MIESRNLFGLSFEIQHVIMKTVFLVHSNLFSSYYGGDGFPELFLKEMDALLYKKVEAILKDSSLSLKKCSIREVKGKLTCCPYQAALAA